MFRILIIIFITILFAISFCFAQNSDEPHFGICGYLPREKPMLYKYILNSGTRILGLSLSRQDLLETGLDKDIDELKNRNIEIILQLRAGTDKINLKEYANFIYKLTQRFKDKIQYYELENEPYLKDNWPGTSQEYFQLLKRVYQATHKANPEIKIANGAVSIESLIYYRVNELLQKGKTQEAQELYKKLDAEGDIQQFIKTEPARRAIDFVGYLLEEGYQYLDGFMLLTTNDYALIDETLEYAKSKMHEQGWGSKPILLKTAWNSKIKSNEEERAQDLIKIFSIILGRGVDKVIWLSIDDVKGRPYGLITKAPGNIPIPKPAYNTFKLMREKLEGFMAVEKISLGEGISAFKFMKSNKSIYILWSQGNKTLNFPVASATVRLTDIYGRQTSVNIGEAQTNLERAVNLDLTSNPIFVEEG